MLCVVLSLMLICWANGASSATTTATTPMTREQLIDTLAQWVFSEQAHLSPSQWEDVWKRLDENGDGRITVQEFADGDLYAPMLGAHGAQAIFDYHDKAGTGQADGQVLVTDSIYSFKMMDRNGDGFLTEGEFRHGIPEVLDAEAEIAALLG